MIGKLLAINLKSLLAGVLMASSRGGKKKPSSMKIVLILLLFVYCIGAFIFILGLMFQQICQPFYSIGLGWLYFAIIALMAFALCVITTIFAVQSLLFGAKDNELLLSMPIKPSSIVLSRLLTLLVYEYLFDLVIIVPALFVWWSSGFATLGGTILFIAGMMLVPLLALAVSSLVGWGVAALSSRMRNKNIITLIFSLAFLGGYLWVYTQMQLYVARLVENGAQIAEAVRKAAFPFYHFGLASAEGSIVSFLLFALCAIAPFAIICAVLIRSFVKIATTKRSAAKIVYKERALRASGARISLVKNELRRFMSNAMVLMNAGIGGIFMLIGAAVVLIKPSLVLDTLETLGVLTGIEPVIFCAAAIMMLCSMVTLSASSISLEGKTLWLVKSLPISNGDILMSKVFAHIVFSGLPALIASACCVIRLGASQPDALAAIIAPMSLSVAMGFFGVVINLIFPKLDWINELQAVKQGMSVVICLFGVMVLVIALIIIYILLPAGFMSVTIYLLVCSAILLALSGLMYLYLMRGGSKRFAALV